MAIKLSVEPYCQDCPDFDPKASTQHMIGWNPMNNYQEDYIATVVTCVNSNRCKMIFNHIKNSNVKENE